MKIQSFYKMLHDGNRKYIGDLWWWYFHFFFFFCSVVVAKIEYYQLPSEHPLPITAWFPSLREKKQSITNPHLTSWELVLKGTHGQRRLLRKFMVNETMANHAWKVGPGLLLFSSFQLLTDAQAREPYLWLLSRGLKADRHSQCTHSGHLGTLRAVTYITLLGSTRISPG